MNPLITKDFISGLSYLLLRTEVEVELPYPLDLEILEKSKLGECPIGEFDEEFHENESLQDYIIRLIGQSKVQLRRYVGEVHFLISNERFVELVTFDHVDFIDGIREASQWIHYPIHFSGYFDRSNNSRKRIPVE